MKWKPNYTHPDGWTFMIEHEMEFDTIHKEYIPAYYLLAFDDKERIKFSYRQDELEAATEQAFEKWGVPEDSWVKAEE